MVAGAGFSPARARWMVRRSERASADEPSRLHPLRPPAARRGVPATFTTPLHVGSLKRSGLRNGCRTASSGGFRGRARVRFWHAVGREDPIGRLRCEFEVGFSLKYARAGEQTKRAVEVKQRPVQPTLHSHEKVVFALCIPWGCGAGRPSPWALVDSARADPS